MEKGKRGKRITAEQKKILIDFLESNKILITGKCHPLQTKELDDKWEQLANILNEESNGAKKDVTQWKQSLAEIKSKVRKKARTQIKELKTTGGGECRLEGLTDFENRLMGLIGWVTVTGCVDLPEEIDPEINAPQETEIQFVYDNLNLTVQNDEEAKELEPDSEVIIVEEKKSEIPKKRKPYLKLQVCKNLQRCFEMETGKWPMP